MCPISDIWNIDYCREKDDSLQKAVQRILSVWEERNVFEHDSLTKFKAILCKWFVWKAVVAVPTVLCYQLQDLSMPTVVPRVNRTPGDRNLLRPREPSYLVQCGAHRQRRLPIAEIHQRSVLSVYTAWTELVPSLPGRGTVEENGCC